MKNKYDFIGLGFAINGIKIAMKQGRNIKIHLFISVMVVIAALCFPTSAAEKLILLLTIGIVIFAELINTAVEITIDLVCKEILKEQLKQPEINERAKSAKDIAAGAVLVTAWMAVIIGVIIFLPNIMSLFKDL